MFFETQTQCNINQGRLNSSHLSHIEKFLYSQSTITASLDKKRAAGKFLSFFCKVEPRSSRASQIKKQHKLIQPDDSFPVFSIYRPHLVR